MSKSGETTFDFVDGPHVFRLDIGGFIMLEDLLGVGPAKMATKIAAYDWGAKWPREIVRVALIRAGMAPLEALALVEIGIDNRPVKEWAAPMVAIINAAWENESDAQKKSEGESPSQRPETTTIFSPTSSATVQ